MIVPSATVSSSGFVSRRFAASCSSARRAVAADREAAPSDALIRGESGVALDDRDARHRHVELLGDDLRQRRAHAGAEIDLAGIDGDRAVTVDGEEAVDLVGRHGLARGGFGKGGREAARDREGDDERAAALEEVAAGLVEPVEHVCLPAQMLAAARFTARRMRTWVPQRQRLSASASLI